MTYLRTPAGWLYLAVVLDLTDSFNAYLLMAAGTTLVGSVLFLLLGMERFRRAVPEG